MNLLYWLMVLRASDPLNLAIDQAIANELNNQEWDNYFKEQKEGAIKYGLLTQDEADKIFNK